MRNGDAKLYESIRAYQEALVESKITGSSIAGVFRGADPLAISSISSPLIGDKEITRDTIFPIWSMSKPITTVAMMILYDRGAFRLDDPVSKYIPYFTDIKCRPNDPNSVPYRCENDLLVFHLLTHRSGYEYYGDQAGGGPDLRFPFSDLDDFCKHLACQPLPFEPGTQYVYGLNQAILGRLVEKLSGMEFYEFLKLEIFIPLGMDRTKFYITHEERQYLQPLYRKTSVSVGATVEKRIGVEYKIDDNNTGITSNFDELSYDEGSPLQYGGEGLVSTFDDYRKFCEMLLASGMNSGHKLISLNSFEFMKTVVTPHSIRNGNFDNGFGFACSFFVLENSYLDGTGSPNGIFGWSGYHNTHFWVDQSNNVYGLFMTRTTPFTWEIQRQFRAAVYRALRQ